MATTLGTIRTRARRRINETTASFWTDDELLDHAIAAVRDLWGHLKDTLQDHFFSVNESVSFAADATTLSGVPTDVAEVRRIEPLNLETNRGITFTPKPYNHIDFQAARAQGTQLPEHGLEILYAVTGAGAPVGAPTIYAAPKLSSALSLRMLYVPTLGTLDASSNNPIPGESDFAVEAWVVAHALGRQNPDGSLTPDAGWMAIYTDQRDRIMVRVTPRQTQEPIIAEAMFEDWWNT